VVLLVLPAIIALLVFTLALFLCVYFLELNRPPYVPPPGL